MQAAGRHACHRACNHAQWLASMHPCGSACSLASDLWRAAWEFNGPHNATFECTKAVPALAVVTFFPFLVTAQARPAKGSLRRASLRYYCAAFGVDRRMIAPGSLKTEVVTIVDLPAFRLVHRCSGVPAERGRCDVPQCLRFEVEVEVGPLRAPGSLKTGNFQPSLRRKENFEQTQFFQPPCCCVVPLGVDQR